MLPNFLAPPDFNFRAARFKTLNKPTKIPVTNFEAAEAIFHGARRSKLRAVRGVHFG
ncbi:MAG: hypothetical protein ABSB70_23190 [Candidatus Velthaea sp.]